MLIAQLSDPHVRPSGELYKNVINSGEAFSCAIRHVVGLRPRPDLVLITGDLVDEGSPAEYQEVVRRLRELTLPTLLIPGNHDEPAAFRAAFANHAYLPPHGSFNYVAERYGPVRVVAFDVTVPNEHHGAVGEAALAWLDATLAMDPKRPTIVMMHQPPLNCGVPYLDRYNCRGAPEIAAIIARYPSVERVVCGHVHRFMQTRFAGTILCTAPSVTTAIALRIWPDAAAASFVEPPACLLHHWRPDVGMVTHWSPIGTLEGPFPFA